jgi:DNA primase
MKTDFFAEILERIAPADVIGIYLSLKPSGRSLKGLCPFHSEKTPSFNLNPENGLWHCFGCGAGGNLAQFLMKIENISFQEARNLLAEKAGLPLIFHDSEKRKKQNRIRGLLEASLGYFQQILLKSKEGEAGLQYLETRKIQFKMIEIFQLGMAPFSNQNLIQYLSKQGYDIEEMKEAGLVSRSIPPRDNFSNRLIFPIRDLFEHLVGFGGRTIGKEEPKYLNSPDSSVFKKGENLYAFQLAKQGIAKKNFVLLVEGYLDAIMLHQFGFENTAASLGTSLTIQQAKLLGRYVEKVIVAYDGDKAGLEAMKRAMIILQQANLDFFLLILPEGDDPDSFLRKNRKEAFETLLNHALSPVQFALQLSLKTYNVKIPEEKTRIVDEILPFLYLISNPILRDEQIKLISQELNISESLLRSLVRKKTSHFSQMPDAFPFSSRETEILKWILWEPSLAPEAWSQISPDDFEEKLPRESAHFLFRVYQEKKKEILLLEDIPQSVSFFLSRLSAEPPVGEIGNFMTLISRQKEERFKKELKSLKEEVLQKIKERKLDPTDETYTSYVELLKKMKGGSKPV